MVIAADHIKLNPDQQWLSLACIRNLPRLAFFFLDKTGFRLDQWSVSVGYSDWQIVPFYFMAFATFLSLKSFQDQFRSR